MTQQLPPETQYELLTTRVLKTLSPNANIKHNVQVPTRDGQSTRQIDAYATVTIAGQEISIAVDCKNYSRALGVGEVDRFIGMMEDIQCSKGVLIGTGGFGSGAKRRAAEYGPRLSLCQIFDAENLEFSAPLNMQAYAIKWVNPQIRGILVNDTTPIEGRILRSPESWVCRKADFGEFNAAELARKIAEGDRSFWLKDIVDVKITGPGLDIRTTLGWESVASIRVMFRGQRTFKGLKIPFVSGVALTNADGVIIAQEGLETSWSPTDISLWEDVTEEEILELLS